MKAGALELGIEKAGFWSWDGKNKYFVGSGNDEWRQLTTSMWVCQAGEARSPDCSEDQPARKKSFTLKTLPWFQSEQNGLAVVTFKKNTFRAAEEGEQTRVIATTDGGRSWSLTDKSLPSKYCVNVIGEVTDRILLSCSGSTGDIYESLDYGDSWQLVREHEDF